MMEPKRVLRSVCLSVLIAGGAALTACGLGAADNSAPLTIFDNFAAVAPDQAYRSAQLDPTSLRLVIDEFGIKTIVNLRGENEDMLWYQNERAVADETGVELVDVRMSANSIPSKANLLLLYDTFTTAEHPILIHCRGGADRSGAASAIWRMVVNGEARAAAANELSILHGHFEARHPEMDRLVRIFQPDREWIENEYPAD